METKASGALQLILTMPSAREQEFAAVHRCLDAIRDIFVLR